MTKELRRFQQLVKMTGLSPMNFRMLAVLINACGENDSVRSPLAEMKAAMQVDRKSVGKSAKRLEELGLIRREYLTGHCNQPLPTIYHLNF